MDVVYYVYGASLQLLDPKADFQCLNEYDFLVSFISRDSCYRV